MGLLLVSVFAAMIPTASSQGALFSLESVIDVSYDLSITNEPIYIRGAGKAANVWIKYYVTGAALFGISNNILLLAHKGRSVPIEIVASCELPWATVSVSQQPTAAIPQGFGEEHATNKSSVLYIKVDEDAPAYGKGNIELTVRVPKVGVIQGREQTIQIPFIVGYTPIVTPRYLEGQSKIINPMDTAVFPIELMNMGNARTRVYLELDYIPDGWSAIITDQVTIEEGEGSRATVYLTVRPPKTFGYHDDTATIVVNYTPEMAEQSQFKGDTKQINVLIDSRGISVIGIETLILPIIIIIVILLLVYYFVIKKRFGK